MDGRVAYLENPRLKLLAFTVWHVVALIFFIKFALLLVDGRPCFFMGDSGSYLLSATHRWAPYDRSYTYGLFIRFLTRIIKSLTWVIYCQTVLSALSASSVAVILARILNVPLVVAALCAILCTLEPLQLLSERYILTEAPSTFLFAVYTALALLYGNRGHVWILFAIPIVGVYLVSLRISYLPVVVVSALLPLLSPLCTQVFRDLMSGRARPDKRLALLVCHVLLLALATGFGLRRYETWYGKAVDIPPTFNGADGLFLLSEVAPIVQASDFQDPSFGQRVVSATKPDIRNLKLRTAQHFAFDGLCQTLIRSVDPLFSMRVLAQANGIARMTAMNAVRNHPKKFASLIGRNVEGYFLTREMKDGIEWDEFRDQPLDSNVQGLIARFNLKITRQPPAGPVMNWHLHGRFWYTFLILFPLAPTVYLLVSALPYKRQMLLLTLYAWSQWIVCTVLIERDTPRFETGLAWLFFPTAGLIWSGLNRRTYTRVAIV